MKRMGHNRNEGNFKVVLTGSLLPGISLEEAEKRLSQLFHTTPDKIKPLLQGRSIIIKKDLDAERANHYQQVFSKVGVEAEVVEEKNTLPIVQELENSSPVSKEKTTSYEKVREKILTIEVEAGEAAGTSKEEAGILGKIMGSIFASIATIVALFLISEAHYYAMERLGLEKVLYRNTITSLLTLVFIIGILVSVWKQTYNELNSAKSVQKNWKEYNPSSSSF